MVNRIPIKRPISMFMEFDVNENNQLYTHYFCSSLQSMSVGDNDYNVGNIEN